MGGKCRKICPPRVKASAISRVIITHVRVVALRQVDTTQAITYWLVGRRIVEFYQKGEERVAYGEKVLCRLAADLTARHGRGFSERNLEMMRMFYLQYPISQTLSAKFKLSCKDFERFYHLFFSGHRREVLPREPA